MATAKKKQTKLSASKKFRPTRKDLADAAERAGRIIDLLRKAYPDARCALVHRNAWQLLVATILSAQCTDERVNLVTKDLFKKYRRPADYAAADLAELEAAIRSTGFYRHKARNLQAAAQDVVEKFGGRVPDKRDDLVTLAGVGRKTANVVLGNVFGIPAVVTDTHVIRLARLLGLSPHSDPVKLEQDLMKLLPEEDWTLAGHLLIGHGRQVCIANRPRCGQCVVQPHCAYGRRQDQESPRHER